MARVALGRRVDAHAQQDLFVLDMRRRGRARCRRAVDGGRDRRCD
jgi:hypothetical protein